MATKPVRPIHYLREWRIKRGLTQAQLATATECRKSMISRYETGQRGISLDMQWRFFAALDITPGQFFADPDEPSLDAVVKDLPLETRQLLVRQLRDWTMSGSDKKGT